VKVFITGISGTLGTAVKDILLADKNIHVIGYSRDEKKQSEIAPHPRLTLVLGDVRDERRVVESTRNVDMIYNFAALKQVNTLEHNPEESVETNIRGTQNILFAQRTNKIPRVVFSSTDKACKPINVYGYCKAISEKLILRNPNNVVVRYGNVLASRGSAIPEFIRCIKNNEPVKITDLRMTRFLLKIEDAADFVVKAANEPTGGLKILENMKACYMVEVVNVLAEMLGKEKAEISICGMRPGEKLHEDLYHEYERETTMTSVSAPRFSREELTELLSPLVFNTQPVKYPRLHLLRSEDKHTEITV